MFVLEGLFAVLVLDHVHIVVKTPVKRASGGGMEIDCQYRRTCGPSVGRCSYTNMPITTGSSLSGVQNANRDRRAVLYYHIRGMRFVTACDLIPMDIM